VTNESLAKLYTQYGALVHRRCRTLMGNEADANDALQETFMRVQRYPPIDVAALLPWLYGVASRVCFDQLAQRRRSQPMAARVLGRLKELMGAVTRSTAEDTLCLGGELARLDQTTKEMALLHWLDGLTHEEVADRTGYSRKTVGVKLKAAETMLRAAFGDEAFGGER
jgi:RNA polymerase sigma-70 factor, ECF subfamily